MSTITGAGYFPPNFTVPVIPAPNISVQPDRDEIFIDDLLFVDATDGTGLFRILSVDPVTLGSNLIGGTSNLVIGAPITATDNNAVKITGSTFAGRVCGCNS